MIEITVPRFHLSRLRAPDWLNAAPQDWFIIATVTLVAAIPRLVALTSIPSGLHGDEAWTGLDASRILDEGLIGPYVQSALGQPAGPLYYAAIFVGIFGETVFAIRFAMATLAIATVPLAYAAFRVMFNRTIGAFAALSLAVSLWHLHYSRIAFMVISWPLVEMATLLLFFVGMKKQQSRYFVLAGLVLGCGVYTYNAYSIFIVAFVVLAAWVPLFGAQDLVAYLKRVALMFGVAFVAAVPLLLYIQGDNGYTEHYKTVSLLETSEWENADSFERVEILSDGYRDFLYDSFWEGEPDFADGAGTFPMVNRLSLLLMVAGLGIALWNWRKAPYMALLIMVALLPFGTLLTTQGTYRQTLGIVPFLAALQALPLALLWSHAELAKPTTRAVAFLAVGGALTIITILNMNTYFGKFPDTDVAEYTFSTEYADAVRFAEALPGDPYVLLLANRWGFDYESRRYLAPDMQGEDRSAEFSDGRRVNLLSDRQRDVVYLFLGLYLERIDEVARLYPGGTRYEQTGFDGVPAFRAYVLPGLQPGEEPPVPLPTAAPTPTEAPRPGGDARDGTRQNHLGQLRQALSEYRAEHGAYPDNGGGIQTLCVYPDDVGCELEEILDPLPEDPLGEPTNNGYFYASDGDTFAIYARRESGEYPACSDHPDHLARISSLLCVSGP